MIKYTKEIENQMKIFYSKQNERWKRLYSRIESSKLWYWWLSYIKRLFWCSINTVKKWKEELYIINNDRIRQLWWWRKKETDKNPEISEYFEIIIKDYIAWNPVKSDIKRTNLSPKDISMKIEKKHWIKTSAHIIRGIMKVKWLKKRKMNKGKTLKSIEWRNEQFENISRLKEKYKNNWDPVMSVDVKKKS